MHPPWSRNAVIYQVDVAFFLDANGDGWGDLRGVQRHHRLGRAIESHETACVLNAGNEDAHVRITLYFTDRDPGPARPLHRAGSTDRAPAVQQPHRSGAGPAGHATVIVSDMPVVVQHTRLDSRKPELALLSTVAWPAS